MNLNDVMSKFFDDITGLQQGIFVMKKMLLEYDNKIKMLEKENAELKQQLSKKE